MGINMLRLYFDGSAKGNFSLFITMLTMIKHAQIIPGIRIFWIDLDCFKKRPFGFFVTAKFEIKNPYSSSMCRRNKS